MVTVEYWYSNLSEQTGYKAHQEIAEEDIPKVVMEIFSKGLNVMLSHCNGNTVIFVDNRRFGQR